MVGFEGNSSFSLNDIELEAHPIAIFITSEILCLNDEANCRDPTVNNSRQNDPQIPERQAVSSNPHIFPPTHASSSSSQAPSPPMLRFFATHDSDPVAVLGAGSIQPETPCK